MTTTDDDSQITLAERYSHAAMTGDLTPREGRCDADILLAAGIAASGDREKSVALALYRVSVTGDRTGLPALVEEMAGWLASTQYRPLPPRSRRALVMDVLVYWFEPTCRYCNGAGFVAMPNAPALSAEACRACHGTGRRPVAREVPHAHVDHARWLVERLD